VRCRAAVAVVEQYMETTKQLSLSLHTHTHEILINVYTHVSSSLQQQIKIAVLFVGFLFFSLDTLLSFTQTKTDVRVVVKRTKDKTK